MQVHIFGPKWYTFFLAFQPIRYTIFIARVVYYFLSTWYTILLTFAKMLLSHSSSGEVYAGSVDLLAEAFEKGRDVKIGIKGLCSDLGNGDGHAMDHELFIQLGPCYYYTDRKLFIGESRPLVRVASNIPLRYESENWDFGWIIPRTDGTVSATIHIHCFHGRSN